MKNGQRLWPHEEYMRFINAVRAVLDLDPIPKTQTNVGRSAMVYWPEAAEAWDTLHERP
ncbi:MAG: hypothetical protein ACYCPT_01945 [Acidimicrobiales bacterium]